MPSQPTPQPTRAAAKVEWVNLLDLPDYLDKHKLHITHTRIVGEYNGKLWIEAETRSDTATESEG